MTVASTLNRAGFPCNGVTVDFPINFPFHAAADLVVVETIIATGVQTTKTLTTHYTVSGTTDDLGYYPNGGTVTAVTAPASTVTWTIYRDPDLVQSLNLSENNALPAESLEAQLDYLTMLVQRLKDRVDRSMRQPEGDSANIDLVPAKVDRASKYLAFDADGDPIATAGTTSAYVVTPFMETVLDDTTAAAARTTLGVPSTTEAILDTLIDAKGDLIVGTAADTPAALSVGANGTIPMARSSATAGLAYVAALNKSIYGLTYANNGSDATNDIDIATGGAMDATGAYWMTLGSALTKQSDVAWAVGTNAGWLDTGAVGDSDYYIWLIARSDTGVVDSLCSLSSTAPTMPTNYDFKRLIGWFKRVGGTIVTFKTYELSGGGIELLWKTPTADVNLANTLTTSQRTDAVKVPLNFSTLALLNVTVIDATTNAYAYIHSPDVDDVAADYTASGATVGWVITANSSGMHYREIRTSATGTIAARSNLATVDEYRISTVGFRWARRD